MSTSKFQCCCPFTCWRGRFKHGQSFTPSYWYPDPLLTEGMPQQISSANNKQSGPFTLLFVTKDHVSMGQTNSECLPLVSTSTRSFPSVWVCFPNPMIWKEITFQHPWDHLNVYAFPPFTLV